MMNKIINFIYKFDVIGPSPQIYIFNKKRYQSIFSLVFSLIIIFVSLIFILYSLVNYIQNDRPNVVYSKSNNMDEQKKINLNEMLIMFQALDFKTMKIINESIVNFESTYVAIYDRGQINPIFLNVQKCKPGENLNKKYEKFLNEKINDLSVEEIKKNKNIDDFYCINSDNKDISLFHNPNVGYSFIDLNIILKNQSLYSPEDISIIVVYENNIINHDNKDNPIVQAISYNLIQAFSSKDYNVAKYNFQYLRYETDDGLFFENSKSLKGMSFLDMEYYKDNQKNYDLMNDFLKYNSSKIGTIKFTLYLSNYDYYRRTYKKLQTFLAEISSVVSLLLEIGNQISAFLNEKKMSVDIIGKLFNNEDKKRKYKLPNNNNRIKITPEKINNSFEKNITSIDISISSNQEIENKNEKLLKKINIFNIIKSLFCNGNKEKLISLSHEIILQDMSVETILDRFYNLTNIYKSIMDVEKYNSGLNKDPRFRKINSIINEIYILMGKK